MNTTIHPAYLFFLRFGFLSQSIYGFDDLVLKITLNHAHHRLIDFEEWSRQEAKATAQFFRCLATHTVIGFWSWTPIKCVFSNQYRNIHTESSIF